MGIRIALLLTGLALGVGWQDDAGLRGFRRAFRPARRPGEVHELRAAAIDALAGEQLPAVARELIDAYVQLEKEAGKPAERHRNALTRAQKDTGAALRPEIDGLRELQDRLLAALAQLDQPAAAAYALERVLEQDRLPLTLRLGVAPLAGRLGDAAHDPLSAALGQRRRPATLATALVGTRALGPAGAPLGELALAALAHRDAAVREAAADALAALLIPTSIEPLVARLDREQGRTRRRMADALQVITRRRIGPSPAAWRSWLEGEGGPYVAGEVELGGGHPDGRLSEAARYHSIPLEGEAVLFLIDRSRSMSKRMQEPPKGGGEKEVSRELRFDRARAELIRALESLSPRQAFGLIGFAGSMERFSAELLPATPRNVEAAVEWVGELSLALGTNIYGALELAFLAAGRGVEDELYETEVETIFLLTDGRPYVATGPDDPERILSGVRRWNPLGRVIVHAIGLGDGVPLAFLGGLARENGGRFVLETLDGGVDVSARPNIVLFLVDDLGWRDPAYAGGALAATPNMDRLARQGMTFASAYANAPNCAPSRACLLTGLYAPRHGIYTVKNSDRGEAHERRLVPIENTTELAGELVTLPEALRAGGYATAAIGKWHLGPDPTEHGFDVNVGGGARGSPGAGYFSPWGLPALADGPGGAYLTERLTDEAVSFVRAHAREPFFLYLSHYGVHTPLQAPADRVATFVQHGLTQRNATYAAMVESVDQSLGRVLDELDELDLSEDTLVVFSSDNGALSSVTSMEPLRGQKGTPYEAGLRVPLAVRWPGRVRAGAREVRPVIGSDLYPTLLDVAGVAHAPVDGESLVPLLLNTGGLDRPAIFWHFPAYLEPYGDSPDFRARPFGAVRKGPLKLIEHFEDGRLELFHLREDPGETRDLADVKPAKRDELHELLLEWREETGAPVPTEPEPAFGRPPAEGTGR